MEKVKVLQVAGLDHFFKYFLRRLVDGMSGAGWQVVCACGDSGYTPILRAEGMDIRTIPYSRTVNPLAHIPTVFALAALMRREKFDVVHVHNPLMSLIARSAATFARPPLVIYTAHGFYFHEHMPPWKRFIGLNLERMAAPWTDYLFTQNREDAELAVRLGLYRADRTLVIGNGADLRIFNPALIPAAKRGILLRELGIPQDARIVGMVTRYTRDKGLMEYLEAAANLRAVLGDVWFIIVGGPAEGDRHPLKLEELKRIAAFYGIGDRVVFTGVRQDMPAVLSLFDVFVLPSYREGMPRSVLEAMAMEVPIVATDIRGCREEVTDGIEGYLVPVKDAETLTDRVLMLLNDRELARRMGQAGRRHVLADFNEESIVKLQIETISQLLASRRAKK
jgi:glycosyltransferase involved in cell wall biosynthesis